MIKKQSKSETVTERRTGAGGGGVAGLDKEVLDDAVEDGVIVVVFEGELDEVSNGFGSLLGP